MTKKPLTVEELDEINRDNDDRPDEWAIASTMTVGQMRRICAAARAHIKKLEGEGVTYPPEMLPSPEEGADVFVENNDGSFRKVYSTDAPQGPQGVWSPDIKPPLPSEGERKFDCAGMRGAREIAAQKTASLKRLLTSTPDQLKNLVQRFSQALLEKLKSSEAKYGWQNAWAKDDWADTLRLHIREHVEKGDPRDVAAYCAFAWHHGWSLTTSMEKEDGTMVDDASRGADAPLPSEGENSGDFLKSLGDDADKWAEAFCSQFPSPLYTQEIVMGWFANAIEHSFDIRTGRRECAEHLLGLTPTTSMEKEDENSEGLPGSGGMVGADNGERSTPRELEKGQRALAVPVDGTIPIVSAKPMELDHASDCAVNNGPALPLGPCDCGETNDDLRPGSAGVPPVGSRPIETQPENLHTVRSGHAPLTPSPMLVERLNNWGFSVVGVSETAALIKEAAAALETQAMCIHQMKASAIDLDKAEETIAALRAELEIKENERHAASVSFANAQAEIAALKHDLERQMDIATKYVNECERLRAENEELVKDAFAAIDNYEEAQDTIKRLERSGGNIDVMRVNEINRLRAALEKIAQCKDDVPHSPAAFINAIAEEGTKDEAIGYLHKEWNVRTYLQHIARAALAGEGWG